MAKHKIQHEWNDLDDFVWYMDDNKAKRDKIVGLWRAHGTIYYLFGDASLEFTTKLKWTDCFNTKEALLASL